MNANEHLKEHTCSDNYFKHYFGTVFTDGVKALCDKFSCYWFLDVVTSYQPKLRSAEFQVWTLTKNNGSTAIVTCEDGNGQSLIQQKIPFTDFEPQEATIWMENGVILLPSEH